MSKIDLKQIFYAAIFPFILVVLLWLVKYIETSGPYDFSKFGLYPRNIQGLKGILLAPFLHADWKHLFNNSIPLLILGWAMFYFYKEVAWKVLVWVLLMGGFWTWISARESFHIGASGVVYGLFAFLLFSGFIRKNKQLISISFLVAFLYGSLVWGLLPIDYRMSWESHLWGFVAGFSLAVYYRKIGRQQEKHVWDEREEELLEHMDFWKTEDQKPKPEINIIFKKKEEN